jgi:hypothetical protein
MGAVCESIPNIPLVIFDLVLGQYLLVLILARQSAMMLALVGDQVAVAGRYSARSYFRKSSFQYRRCRTLVAATRYRVPNLA